MSVDPVVGCVLFVGVVALGVGFLTLVARACDWVAQRRCTPEPDVFDWAEREPHLALPSSHVRIVREQSRKGAA